MDLRPESSAASIAMLVALPKERDALLNCAARWQHIQDPSNPLRTYHQTTLPNGMTVLAAMTLGMGQVNAALLTKDVFARWTPRAFVLVGIAGGVASEVRLGDIVVSEQIVDYELGKVTPEGQSTRWNVYRADSFLLGQVRAFRGHRWKNAIRARRPMTDDSDGDPRVHLGVVLSGNKVIASAAQAGVLRAVWTKAVAVEMEAAGVAAALDQQRPHSGFIVVKSVCDRSDERKDDRWQEYAAAASATYAMAIARQLPRDFFDSQAWMAPGDAEVRKDALEFVLSTVYDKPDTGRIGREMDVDWRAIEGMSRRGDASNLVSACEHAGRLDDLIARVGADFPGLIESYGPPVPPG